MHRTTTTKLTALTLLAVAVLSPLALQAAAPAPDRATARYEIRFLEGMIDHHYMAVQMAQLCHGRTIHSDLQTLCNNIVAAQTAEIQQMQSWLSSWYGVQYSPELTNSEQRQLNQFASLSGEQFEIQFMQMMIQHHSTAISRAEECVDKAYHQELIDLCENIISTQSAEIQQMQKWLCRWYRMCQQGGKK